MATLISEEVNIHYLTNLKEELTIFMNRSKIEIQQAHLHELGESFLDEINERFSSQNQIIRSIAFKWSDFINSWLNIKEEHELQITEMSQLLQEKSIEIDNLQEIVTHLEKKVHSFEEEYDRLKTDVMLISERTEKLEGQCTNYKSLLTKTQKELQQTCEKNKHVISTIINQKEIILNQIQYQRKISIELKDQVDHLEKKVEEYERQCKIYETDLQESYKYHKQLENILNEKNETITQLENQILQIKAEKTHLSTPFGFSTHQLHEQNPDPENTQEIMDKSIKLEDEIPFGEPFAYQFHRRLSELNFNPNRLLDDEPSPSICAFKMNMDPYFAHFVLTSQSVKIKQDNEQLLNIDAKPFYSQIVQKRIPMHLWDQWIRNKLREVLKLRKASNQQDSQDEQ